MLKKAKSQRNNDLHTSRLIRHIVYAESFFLPKRLLLDKIFLPDAVLILFLNPCSLLL